ncbi:MAG: hypothetical protein LUC47_00035 [Clostridiales bacterium]|nr:hypothetical protein [Clostridiales bacterium]
MQITFCATQYNTTGGTKKEDFSKNSEKRQKMWKIHSFQEAIQKPPRETLPAAAFEKRKERKERRLMKERKGEKSM